MLLRIIDNQDLNGNENSIRIVLESNGESTQYFIKSFNSPISRAFSQTLAWYFKDYVECTEANTNDRSVVEKLIKFGQYMGDELLGEDHQLIKFKDVIEKLGYQYLDVSIESSRTEFFMELWEIAIFHNSKYVLSAAVRSFERKFIEVNPAKDLPELRYDLKVTRVTNDPITQLLQSDKVGKPEGSSNQKNKDKPLRVLYLLSRPKINNFSDISSNSINQSLSACNAGGFIDYEIHQNMSWEQLQKRLADKHLPIHIVQYDGPIVFENNIAQFVLEDYNGTITSVDARVMAKAFVDNKIGVFNLDAKIYLRDNQFISAAEGLAHVAKSMQQEGLGNLLGLNQITNPWISSKCFEAVYIQILKGLSFSQAVVEARKTLQSTIELSLFTPKSIPFHYWPLLTHYSKQSVIFFESAQTNDNQQSSFDVINKKLFGFHSELLPPLLEHIGDGQALSLISQLYNAQQLARPQTAEIKGGAGVGKSHLAHLVSLYLVQKQKIDYAFYFNFTDNNYSSSDMLDMIAPVFNFKPGQIIDIEKKLTEIRCCFVLDDIQKPSAELKEFLQNLASSRHIILTINEPHSNLGKFSSIHIELTSLPVLEQKIIAADTLRQFQLLNVNLDNDWNWLLESLNGNPWLAKKIVPMLSYQNANELNIQVNKHINQDKYLSKIDCFYDWQWERLNPFFQKLLMLCSEVHGLLLEMIMTATDQKESFPPARQLFSMLGQTDVKFSDAIALFESSGFLSRFPHGRVVDQRCLSFLATKRKECFENIDQEKLQFHFSQIICEGVSYLAQHVIKQPNPSISNNLLFNRRHWVKHFENLWFNEDYRGFIKVKRAFDQLLEQVQLLDESKAWSLNLLERSSLVSIGNNENTEGSLCWLTLASDALTQADARSSQTLTEGANFWQSRLDAFSPTADRKTLILGQQVLVFLELLYQSNSNWSQCIAICEKSSVIYEHHQAWQKLIYSLKSLAQYHHKLDHHTDVLACEEKIISKIPYTDAPAGFKEQQMLDVILARLSRGDSKNAQILLNELKQIPTAEKLLEILEGIQSDIYYHEKNYVEALPYYSKIWARALQLSQHTHVEQLRPRMLELEQKIGIEYFNKHFEQLVPKGTLKPKDYVSSLH